MTEEAKPTPRERQLEQHRCGVCGLIHPFLVICPFIEERETRYEYALDGAGRRRARFRIERTKYFPRPELFKALEEVTDEGSLAEKPGMLQWLDAQKDAQGFYDSLSSDQRQLLARFQAHALIEKNSDA